MGGHVLTRTTVAAVVGAALFFAGHRLTLRGDAPSTSQSPMPGAELSEAQRLAISDPKRDFALDRDKSDIHFWAVMGVVTDVVGVEGADEAYLKQVPIKTVQGTTDELSPSQDRATREKVRRYVQAYNKLVVEFLRERDRRSK